MEEIRTLFEHILNREFIRAVISGPRAKDGVIRVKVRPVEMKGKLLFQLESFTSTQAFHENLDAEAAKERLAEYMGNFR